MKIKDPGLDNRLLEDIANQLRDLAGKDLPEWKPPQEGDLGTTLHLIFARFLELVLARLNRVPEKNLMSFLNMVGLNLISPSSSRVPLTFSLTSGTPPTLVPKETQVATKPSGQTPSVTYETGEDLTVIPTKITMAYTVDPHWDRLKDWTSKLDGSDSSGFTPFVGVERMPHILYVGDEYSLNFKSKVDITISFKCETAQTDMIKLFEKLSCGYNSEGTYKESANKVVELDLFSKTIKITLSTADPIDKETINGVGVERGIQSRWLKLALKTPIMDSPMAKDLKLSNTQLMISASNLLPDTVYYNDSPVDATKEFLPFGSAPKNGDLFYIGYKDILSKPNVSVTIITTIKEHPVPTLTWEYLDDKNSPPWQQLIVIEDGTSGFTKSGKIKIENPNVIHWYSYAKNFEKWMGSRITSNVVNPAAMESTVISAQIFQVKLVSGLNLVPQITKFELENPSFTILPLASLKEDVRVGGKTLILVTNVTDFKQGDQLTIDDGQNSEPIIIDTVSCEKGIATITTHDPLTFTHTATVHVGPKVEDFFVFIDRQGIDLKKPFYPFGTELGIGKGFIFGSRGGFPTEIIINVEVSFDIPKLRWELFGENGWEDFKLDQTDVNSFLKSGEIQLEKKNYALTTVNDQSNYWIRVSIIDGNYGLPIEYVPVDPSDSKQGFKVKDGTGNVNPPIIEKLQISYNSTQSNPIVLTQNSTLYCDNSVQTINGSPDFMPFKPSNNLDPKYSDNLPSFYIGFDVTFPEQPVTIYFESVSRSFAGSVTKEKLETSTPMHSQRLQWEYFNGSMWTPLVVFDNTNNLTESGGLKFLTPIDMAPIKKFDLTPRYYIRTKSDTNDPFETQRIMGVFLNTVGGTQAMTIKNEVLGSSNGQANQSMSFVSAPVLPQQQVIVKESENPSADELQVIEQEEGQDAVQINTGSTTGETEILVRWHEVDSFSQSDSRSRHYVLDHTTGIITFGDNKKGMIPPTATKNISATYRTGGGTTGNVPAGSITQVKSPPPGIAGVINQVGGYDGATEETIEMAKKRGPQLLKHRLRGLSGSDFEWLARQAVGTQVARAMCLPNVNRDLYFEPGWITMILVPQGSDNKLSPSSELIRGVEDYLKVHAFAGLTQDITKVNLLGPGYIQVRIIAEIVPEDIEKAEAIKNQATISINTFFHPLKGGLKGTGWDFGRNVYSSEVFSVLQNIPYVNHVESLQLIPNAIQNRLSLSAPIIVEEDMPAGSFVVSKDQMKASLLAESISAGSIDSIQVKGFKEGDIVMLSIDCTNPIKDPNDPNTITVNLGNNPISFPIGSIVSTLYGSVRTKLTKGIDEEKRKVVDIGIEDEKFVSNLKDDDIITISYPFPMYVTSVTKDRDHCIVNIKPYVAGADFPAGCMISRVDNRVRLPLVSSISSGQQVATLILEDFRIEEIRIISSNKNYETNHMTISSVQSITDIVYLDDNFLVYPGTHQISIVEEEQPSGGS